MCSALLLWIPFFKRSGLGKWILPIFALKITAGFVYALYYKLPKNYAGADTWRFFHLSLPEKQLLLTNPALFVTDLFTHGYTQTGSLFTGENNYWNDLKSNFFVKIMAVMNVFTASSYFTNIIIFNFLFLFGLVGVFRIFQLLYPGKKWLLVMSVFFIPSPLFWCSGIHKDGLILSAVGLLLYLVSEGFKNRKFGVLRLLQIALCMILIFFLRNYVLFALVPALLCWWLTTHSTIKKSSIFILLYLAGIILFFTLPKFFAGLNFPAFLVAKQHEFLLLEGGSLIRKNPLEPTFTGFIKFLPSALEMVLLRPFPTETKSLSYLPAIAEVLIIILLLLLLLIFPSRKPANSFLYCVVFFAASTLLICGYTIPFTGAIVRYRSVLYPLIIPIIVCSIRLPMKFKRIN